jgi:hypothetical protein
MVKLSAMIYFNKWFKIPGPADLGMSENNNAMGSDLFPQDGIETWENYYARVQKEYPVRFFFASILPGFLRHIWRRVATPVEDAIYWFKCHTLTSHRFHLLDLRQPRQSKDVVNYDCYRYGWCDVPEKMLYAIFNLLGEYLEEGPHDLTQWYSREEINADAGYKSQQDAIEEARAIHHWWLVTRKEERAAHDKKLSEWSDLQHNDKTRHNGEADKAFKELDQIKDANEAKIDEMIARLMKIRRTLWT